MRNLADWIAGLVLALLLCFASVVGTFEFIRHNDASHNGQRASEAKAAAGQYTTAEPAVPSTSKPNPANPPLPLGRSPKIGNASTAPSKQSDADDPILATRAHDPESPTPSTDFQQSEDATAPVQRIPSPPKSATVAFVLLPGQSQNFPNNSIRRLTIQSEYPIQILSGACRNDYTVQWTCDGDPHDVFVRDLRRPPVFMTPRSNTVRFTAWRP